MKKLKKILSLILAFCIFTTLHVTVSAESIWTKSAPIGRFVINENYPEIRNNGMYKYFITQLGNVILVEVVGNPQGELILPTEIEGRKVSALVGGDLFANCDGVTSLTIPDGFMYSSARIGCTSSYEGDCYDGCEKITKSVLEEAGYPMVFNMFSIMYLPKNLRHLKIGKNFYGFDYNIEENTKLKYIDVDPENIYLRDGAKYPEQLPTPSVTVTKGEISVGEVPEFSWKHVPGADFYTIWDWGRNTCYDNITQTYVQDLKTTAPAGTDVDVVSNERFAVMAPFTEPGEYAISVYARNSNYEYMQSEPASFNITVKAQEDIGVNINGRELDFDVPPQIINERTMVPLRGIFEALGATVTWNEAEQKVRAENRNHVVDFVIGATTMNVWHLDGSGPSGWMYLDSPAVIIDGRTLVPARAVAEAFNCDVQWDSQNRQVSITPRN